MTEYGVFGWDGPDARYWDGELWPEQFDKANHRLGYNILYLDMHAKLQPYGRKWATVPATGWPPWQAPQCP